MRYLYSGLWAVGHSQRMVCAEASTFQGVLPAPQDYYILVKGRPDVNTSYTMPVTIPSIP